MSIGGPAVQRFLALVLLVASCADRVPAPRDPSSDGPQTAPPSLRHHVLESTEERTTGPVTAALQRHQGESPLVYVTRRARQGGCELAEYCGPWIEIAVFADGTIAVDRHACSEPTPVRVKTLPPSTLSDLRTLLGERCRMLPQTDEFCLHGSIGIECLGQARQVCGSASVKLIEGLAESVAAQLDVEVSDDGLSRCERRNRWVGETEIHLTLHPRHTTYQTFRPK